MKREKKRRAVQFNLGLFSADRKSSSVSQELSSTLRMHWKRRSPRSVRVSRHGSQPTEKGCPCRRSFLLHQTWRVIPLHLQLKSQKWGPRPTDVNVSCHVVVVVPRWARGAKIWTCVMKSTAGKQTCFYSMAQSLSPCLCSSFDSADVLARLQGEIQVPAHQACRSEIDFECQLFI